MRQIIPTTEPFFFQSDSSHPGRAAGCLLIHGFTGTPKEMRWMGEYLNREGYAVLGIRLAGHATKPADMTRVAYTDWLASVEDGFHILAGVAEHIYLIGLSMGGILALHAAARMPARGVVAMSTPYALPGDWRLNMIGLLSMVQPYIPKGKETPDAGWFDKESFKQHVSYPNNPVRAIGELKKLMEEMHATLPGVRIPALLIHSRDDDYVSRGSMQRIYDQLATTDKEMMWIEGSGHVITEEPQREQVFRAAADFIRRVEANR
jgi:carboxylesterase